MAMSDRRVPRGNRLVLTDEECDELLALIKHSGPLPSLRLVVAKLMSVRPEAIDPEPEEA